MQIESFIQYSENDIENYFDRLWPICRSITGEGFRQSLAILQEIIPLELFHIPSGTKVLDWTVPDEWNIREAYVLGPTGKRILDFKNNNLHVLNYSAPIDIECDLEELDQHLHSLEELPHAIPYRTSYYEKRWGFCLSHLQRMSLKPGRYRAVIDSTLSPGHLSYGHFVLPATTETNKEILISTYLCHPSMANNELSGPLTTAFIYNALKNCSVRNLNYRFIFVAETIGSITYLAKWGDHLKKHCVGGLVVTCCGDGGNLTYKKSRQGQTLIDRCALLELQKHEEITGKKFQVYNFFPTGADERQYCSPGFNLPVGSLMRSMYGKYQEYHTSLDNKEFISFPAMLETLRIYLRVLLSVDINKKYLNLFPYGEPMLGPRGLYSTLGSAKTMPDFTLKVNYLLNFSDGEHDLCQIAEKSGFTILDLAEVATCLLEKGLIKEITKDIMPM